jgi:hypothetical protein
MFSQYNIITKTKYNILISILGLILVLMITFFPPTITTKFSWRKPLIGTIFSIFCFLGILATFSPNQCGKSITEKKETGGLKSDEAFSHQKRIFLRGHHPTCGNFEGHLFRIKSKEFCAACKGLLIGAFLALAVTIGYFFFGWKLIDANPSIVFLGMSGVTFGLLEFKFRSLVRLLSNTIFVLGALLILIGIDKLVQSLFFDLFIVSLIAFWLSTRISISKSNHETLCSICDIKNCEIKEKKKI